ncbi:MAG: glucose PTS transporter subunit IIA [Lachnospiraceae bacterium]|nr:glucose PTS transporter subunit IIA [Lachnospiraceae bacterium]MDD3614658.1 glucose PTS transporter subunit IIA [Lachnospiraceae bacterium]
MLLDYTRCAQEIYETLGGRDNLINVAHCATRLRIVAVNDNNIDTKRLEDIEGVKGVFSNNGQLQLILGTGAVNKVYEEFLHISGMEESTTGEVKDAADKKQPVYKRMIKSLGDVFIPILPAIVASGLMMGLVEALGNANPDFASGDWYALLDMLSNTAFVFLPVLIAASTAHVFGGNIYLGAVVGMLMIHPNLINAWTAVTMETSQIPVWHILGIPIRQVGYQGHVIPIIISVWVMCRIECWLHKHVPEMIDLFVTPLCSVLVSGFLALGIIGPVFSIGESYILEFAQWLIKVEHSAGAMLMGGIYPITVVAGIHHMYNVIEAGMLSAGGLNTWMPIASAANFAQGAACLAVGLKSGNKKIRAVALPSALSAALGITEPAIFGVNLRFGRPFVCGMMGGAVGAWVGAVFSVGATSYGVTGIPGFLITMDSTVHYAVSLMVAFGVSYVLTWIFWKEKDTKTVFKNQNNCIYAPVSGTLLAMNQIPDKTFAEGILGDGVGIIPEMDEITAPFDGVISVVMDTGHAVGITSTDGIELLIHVGIDTVSLKGQFFECCVRQGQKVKVGEKLISFERREIETAGYNTTVAVMVLNAKNYRNIIHLQKEKLSAGEEILKVEK